MIPPTIPPVKMYRGDTLAFPGLTFQSNGLPVDLAGLTLSAQWRRTATARASFPITVHVADPTSGHIELTMNASITSSISDNGVWDLQSTDTVTGHVRTLARGTTILIRDVTR